jgi:hypothetical protein
LAADEKGCVYSKTDQGYAKTLVWPKGYTVKGDSKSFEILDASKNVVARSGTTLSIGGGGGVPFQDTWTEPDCNKGSLFMVSGVSG